MIFSIFDNVSFDEVTLYRFNTYMILGKLGLWNCKINHVFSFRKDPSIKTLSNIKFWKSKSSVPSLIYSHTVTSLKNNLYSSCFSFEWPLRYSLHSYWTFFFFPHSCLYVLHNFGGRREKETRLDFYKFQNKGND